MREAVNRPDWRPFATAWRWRTTGRNPRVRNRSVPERLWPSTRKTQCSDSGLSPVTADVGDAGRERMDKHLECGHTPRNRRANRRARSGGRITRGRVDFVAAARRTSVPSMSSSRIRLARVSPSARSPSSLFGAVDRSTVRDIEADNARRVVTQRETGLLLLPSTSPTLPVWNSTSMAPRGPSGSHLR